jgi:hypothetical protein
LPNCPTPAVIENTINIASSNNDKINEIFDKILIKDNNCYSFYKDKYNRFEMRFFANEMLIKNKLLEEEKKYAVYDSPRCRVF